jgi:hypothetical protein
MYPCRRMLLIEISNRWLATPGGTLVWPLIRCPPAPAPNPHATAPTASQPASQPDDIMAHGREKASSWNHGWEKLVKLWCRCCTLQTILPRLLPSACLADVGSAQPRRRDDEGNACRDSPIPCSACARSVRVEVVAEEHDGKPMGPWPCPSQSSDLEVDHDVGAVPSATSVIIDVARLGDRPPQIHEDIFTYIYIYISLSQYLRIAG